MQTQMEIEETEEKPTNWGGLYKAVLVRVAGFLWPEEFLPFSGVCQHWHKALSTFSRWEKQYTERFGQDRTNAAFFALQNLEEVVTIPPLSWKRVYIQDIHSLRGFCSLCGKNSGAFSEGSYKFCTACWTSGVVDREKAEQILQASFGPDKYQNFQDMEITLNPSMRIGQTDFMLLADVYDFITLLDETPKNPPEIHERPWRQNLEQILLANGMDWQKSRVYAQNTFPPDGLTLDQVAQEILKGEGIHPRVVSLPAAQLMPTKQRQPPAPQPKTKLKDQIFEDEMLPDDDEDLDMSEIGQFLGVPLPQVTEYQRQEQLMAAMNQWGIPWSVAANYPFNLVVQNFISGKGGITQNELIGMMQGATKHIMLSSALDNLPPRN